MLRGERIREKMKKKIIIAGICIIALCAVIVPKFTKPKQFAQAVALPVMDAEKPETGDIRLTTSVIGKIEPSDVVYIYPKAAGDVTEVNVKAGDIVTKGQVLCNIDTKQVESAKNTMDSAALTLRQAQEELSRQQLLYAGGGLSDQQYSQYQNAVSSAQINYDQAKNTMDSAALTLRQAQEELSRQQLLYAGGGLSDQQYSQYQNAVSSAQINYDQAKYNYETQLEYSQITAPMEGLVEICNVENYDNVSQGNLIFVISGQGSRVVSFSTTERIRGYLKEGDTIDVEKDGQTYEGTVYEVSTMADETTGLYKVKASVDADVVLPTGSEVKLYVTSEKAEGVMTIPVDAVYYENGEPYVYTYSDGKVWQKFIEEGIFDSDILEVKSGLSMDDMVVTTWSSELYDGAEVRLKGETTQDDSTGDAAGAPAGGPEGNAPGGPGAPMTGNKAQ